MARILERSKKLEALPAVQTVYTPAVMQAPVPRPELHHPVLAPLFDIGPLLPADIREAAATLPPETVAADLTAVIRYFIDDFERYRSTEGLQDWGILHAFLLGGLVPGAAMREGLMLALSQPEEVIGHYFGDLIFEGLWWSIYQHLSGDGPEYWFGFLKRPSIFGSAKVVVLHAIQHRYAKDPELREPLMAGLQELAEQYLLRREETDFADYFVAGELALALIEYGDEGQLQAASHLFEAGLVDEDLAGNYEQVVADRGRYDSYSRDPLPKLEEVYRHMQQIVSPLFPTAGDLAGPAPRLMPQTAPIKAEPKVGRNDPCPCGSGKKYKKCCMNKG